MISTKLFMFLSLWFDVHWRHYGPCNRLSRFTLLGVFFALCSIILALEDVPASDRTSPTQAENETKSNSTLHNSPLHLASLTVAVPAHCLSYPVCSQWQTFPNADGATRSSQHFRVVLKRPHRLAPSLSTDRLHPASDRV